MISSIQSSLLLKFDICFTALYLSVYKTWRVEDDCNFSAILSGMAYWFVVVCWALSVVRGTRHLKNLVWPCYLQWWADGSVRIFKVICKVCISRQISSMYLGTPGTATRTVYFLSITLFVQRHKEIFQYSGYSLLYLYTHYNIYNRNRPDTPKNHQIHLKIASAGINVLKTNVSNFSLLLMYLGKSFVLSFTFTTGPSFRRALVFSASSLHSLATIFMFLLRIPFLLPHFMYFFSVFELIQEFPVNPC